MTATLSTGIGTTEQVNEYLDSSKRRRVDDAMQRFEAEKSKLFRHDGTKLYSDAEHDERETAAFEALNAVVSQIENDAEEQRRAADTDLEMIEVEPIDRLSRDDLAYALTLQPFVREEVESLRPEQVIELARRAIHAKDTVKMTLYHRSLRFKIEALNQQHRDASGSVPRSLSTITVPMQEAIRELGEALKDPKAGEKRKAVEDRLRRAQATAKYARDARFQARGGIEAEIRAQRRRYQEMF